MSTVHPQMIKCQQLANGDVARYVSDEVQGFCRKAPSKANI